AHVVRQRVDGGRDLRIDRQGAQLVEHRHVRETTRAIRVDGTFRSDAWGSSDHVARGAARSLTVEIVIALPTTRRSLFAAASLFTFAFLASCSGAGVPGEGEDIDQVEQNATVCAKGSTVNGIDVSEWQGTVDWKAVKASGRVFAIARISDGTYHDKQFST